jgi:predicted metal-dependent hydrolase
MKKSQRISGFVAALDLPGESDHDPRYLGYFACFNDGQYYEAHDVLEDLWLKDRGGPDGLFFKGLIQLAGAFVHLQKHRLRPNHPKDRGRLAPASRLFQLAGRNLRPFQPSHRHLNVERICRLCDRLSAKIVNSRFRDNPLNTARPPRLELD